MVDAAVVLPDPDGLGSVLPIAGPESRRMGTGCSGCWLVGADLDQAALTLNPTFPSAILTVKIALTDRAVLCLGVILIRSTLTTDTRAVTPTAG